ncbi:6-bladed beta-propeller [Acidobacteriota bacterium]
MKKTFFFLLLFLLLMFESGSGNSKDGSLFNQNKKNDQLVQFLTVGTLEDDLLFQWVGVTVDQFGNIFVTDSLDYSLKKFSSDGNLLKKRGGRGQGPGEFMAPRLLDASKNYLYVTDHLVSGIQVFDQDLQFVRRIPIQFPITDLCVLEDDNIAVAPLMVNRPSRICFYNDTGKIYRVLIIGQDSEGLIMDQFSFVIDDHSNVYVVYTFQDKIEKYDAEGSQVWSTKLLGIKDVNKEKISGLILPTEIVYKEVDLDSRGNIYILGGSFSVNPSRDVYVLSPEGIQTSTLTLPDTSHCIYIDKQDFLYSRANEGVTLKKFKMSYRFNEKKSN